jgi:hypothetical protein
VQNTAGVVNSSESRAYFDKELKMELGTSLYIGVPGFTKAFFGRILNLESIAKTVFEECQEGDNPLFNKEAGGWQGWPSDAKEAKVLEWFQRLVKKFLDLAAEGYALPSRILRQPNKLVPSSVSKGRSCDYLTGSEVLPPGLSISTKSGVVTVATYYHHGTACVGGEDDTIVDNIRKGLDIGRAKNIYKIIAKMKEDSMKKQKDFAS